MLDALTITEEEATGLSELAALDLAMARDFAARAQAAGDQAVANDLARSYQRVARSYRQTLALKMRLARQMAAAEREARENPPPPKPADVRRRMGEIRQAVTRVAFTECEGPEREEERAFVLEGLEDGLYEQAAEGVSCSQPLDEQVAEACEALGLSPALAARWRELPDPRDPPDPDAQPEPDPAWRDTG
ncbi:MAG: hypothetical protein ACXWKM_08060 [Phenylobacterium sp.]